jgi:hypothetical protein
MDIEKIKPGQMFYLPFFFETIHILAENVSGNQLRITIYHPDKSRNTHVVGRGWFLGTRMIELRGKR